MKKNSLIDAIPCRIMQECFLSPSFFESFKLLQVVGTQVFPLIIRILVGRNGKGGLFLVEEGFDEDGIRVES